MSEYRFTRLRFVALNGLVGEVRVDLIRGRKRLHLLRIAAQIVQFLLFYQHF